jgi:NitT/TauT family transport system ATP-binding protein
VTADHTTVGSPDYAIEVDGLTQAFLTRGRQDLVVALSEVSLSVERGEFVSIVGPTGCGKSTLLSAISGLNSPYSGEVRVSGERVSGVRGDIGLIFQQDALLPWRTALQNVELALRFRRIDKRERRNRARDWLDRVGLAKFENAYPHELSGGMRKRVAIAATLVYEPRVLLMDEPFSALDVQTRNLMENDLLTLWQSLSGQTVVFVTHDLEEAIGLSDRVVVISAGPGRVLSDYRVDLPRPRDLLTIRLAPGFEELYRDIWANLGSEVVRANTHVASMTEAPVT